MSDDMLEKYKSDLERDADVMQDQSIEAESDMRFIGATGGMWDDFAQDQFKNRIQMEFNIISPYVNRKIGEWNQNRVGVEFKSKALNTTDDDAELINGIWRADFRDNSGKLSVDNAVDEVMKCGYGCFRMFADFQDEEDIENDLQNINYAPVYNAYQTIFWESDAKRIDKRDATVCHELVLFTREAYEKEWPDASFISAYEPARSGLTRGRNNSNAHRHDLIFIAKRYEVIKKKENVYKYFDLEQKKALTFNEKEHELKKEELGKNEFIVFKSKRKILKQHVETTVFNGDEILEKTKRIAGKWIPIFPLYAYRTYINGEEHYFGLVRDLKDPSRTYNTQISQLVENAASSGQETPILTEQQVAGYEGDWAGRNNKSYLLINELRNSEGIETGLIGPQSYLKPPQLDQSTTTLLQIVPAFIQQITGGAPQDTLDRNMTGKLFRAIQKREDANTQIIFDNIQNTLQWSGVVYLDMALDGIYTREMMVSVISAEGEDGQKTLLQRVPDKETGGMKTINDLNSKKFKVYSDVGPLYATVREQTVEELKGMLELLISTGEKGGDYIDPLISTLISNMDGSGLGPIKKLNRRQMILQGLIPPETEEEKQELAQAQEKSQQNPNQDLMTAAANQANAEARERDSKTLVNTADAGKKQAETSKIVSETENKPRDERVKTLQDIQKQVFKNVEPLPLAG